MLVVNIDAEIWPECHDRPADVGQVTVVLRTRISQTIVICIRSSFGANTLITRIEVTPVADSIRDKTDDLDEIDEAMMMAV